MPAREDSVDVVVLGGGPAGLVAAIQAARAGAGLILVEKQGQLGGTTTTGGINAIQSFFAYGKQVIAGIGWELACRTYEALGDPAPSGSVFAERNGITNTHVDKIVYAAIADQMVLEAGIDLRLHTMLGAIRQQGAGWRLTLCGKEGLYDVNARVVIDCSGDANAVSQAGLDVIRPATRQPGTLVVSLGGYNAAELDYEAIQKAFDAEIAAGRFQKSDTGWFNGNVKPLLADYGGNRIHVCSENAADSRGRTHAEILARQILLKLLRFFRTQPGLGKLTVTWFAPEVGIRETAMIRGRATVTCDDYMSGRVWPDAVSYSFYPIDVHTEHGLDYRPLPRGVVPTIPFGAMLPTKGRNIIVAGRCISGDRLAFSAYRVQASCMGMGQAAGAAAALAIKSDCDVADVPIAELRGSLTAHQAIVPA